MSYNAIKSYFPKAFLPNLNGLYSYHNVYQQISVDYVFLKENELEVNGRIAKLPYEYLNQYA